MKKKRNLAFVLLILLISFLISIYLLEVKKESKDLPNTSLPEVSEGINVDDGEEITDSKDDKTCHEVVVDTMSIDTMWEGTGFEHIGNGLFRRGNEEQGYLFIDLVSQQVYNTPNKATMGNSLPVYYLIDYKNSLYQGLNIDDDSVVFDYSEDWVNGNLDIYDAIEAFLYKMYANYFNEVGCNIDQITQSFDELKEQYPNEQYVNATEVFINELPKNTEMLDGLWELPKGDVDVLWEHPMVETNEITTIDEYNAVIKANKDKKIFIFYTNSMYDYEFKEEPQYENVYRLEDSLDYQINNFMYRFFWNNADPEIRDMLYVIDDKKAKETGLKELINPSFSSGSNTQTEFIYVLEEFDQGEKTFYAYDVFEIINTAVVPKDIKHSMEHYNLDIAYWIYIESSNSKLRELGLKQDEES